MISFESVDTSPWQVRSGIGFDGRASRKNVGEPSAKRSRLPVSAIQFPILKRTGFARRCIKRLLLSHQDVSLTKAHESRNLFLEGPTGRLEAILWKPQGVARPPMAVVLCHPHPLFGGTMHNKVIYQTAKSLDALGLAVLRFNFRGAGTSAGVHDRGRGEQGDVRAALDFLANEFPGVPLLLAGFSFGCWVGLRVGCEDKRVAELIGLGTPVNSSDFTYLESLRQAKTIRAW